MADEMEQVRAARSILVDARHPVGGPERAARQEQDELDAFMAIFHPNHERIVLNDE